MVGQLLATTGLDSKKGGGIAELTRFQEHFHEYKIVVYSGLNCDGIMYQGHVESEKCVNLLFDAVIHHYHFIASLTGAMAKRYICEGCNKGCKYGLVHTCEQICSDCMVHPPCKYAGPEFLVTYVTDTLGFRYASTTIKRKHELKGRAHASCVSVAVRVAL